jgi:hypothetical protein
VAFADFDLELDLNHLAYDVNVGGWMLEVLVRCGVVYKLKLTARQTVNEDNLGHQLIFVSVEL